MKPMKYNPDEVLDSIHGCIRWFNENNESTNISSVSEKLDEFNVLLARFNELCMDAFEVEATLEDEYKSFYAKRVQELVNSGASVNKAENQVVVELIEKKKEWTSAIVTFKKFKSRLERFDKIIDGKRQRISVAKMTEMKNL